MSKLQIKCLILDVDGTLTDGKIHIGKEGELFKSFYARDGYGIKFILPKHDITPVILTARNSEILTFRCEELNITHLHQGVLDKENYLKELCQKLSVSLEEVAYIGDDINDLEAMKLISTIGCPSDAVKEVKEISHYICENKGGNGAVREFIDWIVNL